MSLILTAPDLPAEHSETLVSGGAVRAGFYVSAIDSESFGGADMHTIRNRIKIRHTASRSVAIYGMFLMSS